MNLQPPPEIADGGYWYVLPITPDQERGGKGPGVVPGAGLCAWYSDDEVVIRTPQPITGLQPSVSNAAMVLAAAGYSVRPFGRVGGN